MSEFIDNAYLNSQYANGFEIKQIRFISQTSGNNPAADDIPDEYTGYRYPATGTAELDKLAKVEEYTGQNPFEFPYGNKLRPVDAIDFLEQYDNPMLIRVEYYPFDTMEKNNSSQGSTAVQKYEDDLADPISAAPVSRYYGTVPPTKLPDNFFRPQVQIGTINIFPQHNKTYFAGHKADLSIGYPLPYEANFYLPLQKTRTVKVRGVCRYIEIVGGTKYIRPIPLLAVLTIAHAR